MKHQITILLVTLTLLLPCSQSKLSTQFVELNPGSYQVKTDGFLIKNHKEN